MFIGNGLTGFLWGRPSEQLLSRQNAMLQNTNVLNNCTCMFMNKLVKHVCDG